MINQWLKFFIYLVDGNISIDNNVIERDVCLFMIGCKNWMFLILVGGVKVSVNFYSLVMICCVNDINLYFYFVYLFRELLKCFLSDDLIDFMLWNVEICEVE